MKILWLTPYPINLLKEELGIKRNVSGHPASWIVNLSEELKKNNEVELHILTLAAAIKNDSEFNKENIRFHILSHNIPFINKGYPNYFPLDTILKYSFIKKKIIKYIEIINPDIVHIHGTEGAYPVIIKNIDKPTILSTQGIVNEIYEIEPTIKGFFQKRIEIKGIRNCKYFGCRTDCDKSFVLRINKNAEIFYMAEAINYEFFNHTWSKKKTDGYILFVGSLIKRKGIFTLFSSLSILKKRGMHLNLKIVGASARKTEQSFFDLLDNLDIKDNVTFLGRKNSVEIAELLQDAWLYIHPSFIDNSPNSLAEAMAVGTPCIASNVGGIPSMLENEKNGFLFEAGNVEELAEKIEALLNNTKLQEDISRCSKLNAKRKNYPSVVAKNTLEVYYSILLKS